VSTVKLLSGPSPKPRQFRWPLVLAVAAVAFLIAWHFSRQVEPEIAEPVRAEAPARTTQSLVVGSLGFAQRAVGKVTSDLFAQHSWYTPPPPPPPVKAGPPPPPSAPPFPYRFFGRYERQGDKTVYVLTQDDRVFDVHVGDVIDNTWSVDSAANGMLQVTYLPLKLGQALPIGSMQ
jgi:hypothetical protein